MISTFDSLCSFYFSEINFNKKDILSGYFIPKNLLENLYVIKLYIAYWTLISMSPTLNSSFTFRMCLNGFTIVEVFIIEDSIDFFWLGFHSSVNNRLKNKVEQTNLFLANECSCVYLLIVTTSTAQCENCCGVRYVLIA